MFKTLFFFVIVIHGLIHLLGFFKSFDIGSITQLNTPISKPMGVMWLIVTALFLLTALMYVMNHRLWSMVAIIALVISQIVIFTVWSDAKFGTIVNLIILLVAIPALGNMLFNDKVRAEQVKLLEQVSKPDDRVLQENDFQQLPEIVQTWLKNSGAVGKPAVTFVRLKQNGKMKTEPNGRWMDFIAVQYIDAENPSFVWKVDVRMMPMVTLNGRDKLQNGQGEMLIKLLSFVNVVNEKHSEQINTGTLIRFLGEICWFPSAALSDFIKWEDIDDSSAKAKLTIGDQQVSGSFCFSESGDFLSFEADRYYGGGEDATLEKWKVEAVEYGMFDEFRVPSKVKVTWKLAEGDFTWLHLEITDLEMNRFERFSKELEFDS